MCDVINAIVSETFSGRFISIDNPFIHSSLTSPFRRCTRLYADDHWGATTGSASHPESPNVSLRPTRGATTASLRREISSPPLFTLTRKTKSRRFSINTSPWPLSPQSGPLHLRSRVTSRYFWMRLLSLISIPAWTVALYPLSSHSL